MSTTTKTKKPTTKKATSKPAASPLPTTFTMKVRDLRRILGAVLPAASKDGYRPILSSVRVRLETNETLTFTCTDSYRIHDVKGVKPSEWRAGEQAEVLIPATWLRRAVNTPCDQNDHAVISWGPTQRVHVAINSDSMSTDMIGGIWPDTDGLIGGMPEKVTDGVQAFNPKLLADVFAACRKFGPDLPVRCRAFDSTAHKASAWQVVNRTSTTEILNCVLMPVRVG